MAAEDVELNAFDDDAVGKLVRSVRRLQAQYRNLAAGGERLDRATDGWHIRTGVTATNARNPSYPATGCKFVVQFEDWDFDEVVDGACDRETKAWPEKFVVARTYHGKWIAEGTRVLIVKMPAKRGRRWVILPIPPKLDIRRFELVTPLAFGGNADAVFVDCGGATGSALIVRDSIGEWHGLPTFQGWCVRLDDCAETVPPTYEILFLEAPARWVEFVLTSDMVSGYAAATVARYWGTSPNGKTPGATLTVYDRANLFRRAKTGARGFAVYDERHTDAAPLGRWVVVQSETQAGWVCFTLLDDPQQVAEPTATVNSYWGTQQDIQNPGNTVTCVFCAGHFPHAQIGAQGTAALDAVTGKYRVVTCDQQALSVTAEAAEDFCPSSASIAIASYDVASFFLFGQRPPTLPVMLNLFGLAGHAGDSLWGEYSEAYDEWVAVQATHVDRELMTDMRYNAQGCKLEKQVQRAAIMYCQEPEWKTAIQLTKKQYLSGLYKDVTLGGSAGDQVVGCAVGQYKKLVCVFGEEDGGQEAIIQAVPKAFLTLVQDDGDCVVWESQVGFVLCVGATDSGDVFCTTDCEDQGSGGQ